MIKTLLTTALARVAFNGAPARSAGGDTIAVTPDNSPRAESDLYFANIASDDGFGKFKHHRELSPIANQLVIRTNRDTLYSAAVFDLDTGPVTINLPDTGKRFMSMQIINEDQYTPLVAYKSGKYVLSRKNIGHAMWSPQFALS